jgi:hypothetical protein
VLLRRLAPLRAPHRVCRLCEKLPLHGRCPGSRRPGASLLLRRASMPLPCCGMTSKIFVWSLYAPLSSSQSLHTAPLSFAFRDGAQAVEVGHDADAALVAPFGSVACTHTHDSGIVCCIPRLRCRLPKQPPYARGLSRAEAMTTTLMTNDQLGLKERRDASSAGPPGYPCGRHAVLRGIRYRAVHDGLVLPDVEMPRGPPASVVGATAPVADRAHHLPGPDVCPPSHAGCPAPICAP